MTTSPKHFEGKEAVEHLKAARKKGAQATSEIHGTEMPGPISAGTDSTKETAILLMGMWILFDAFNIAHPFWVLGLFSAGWLLWKVGRSSLLGWARLEKLHRLIEQERWEIQHHRAQEKEELTAMYEQKGLSGKLLEEVIEVLMADDNRLLMVMLEEELGLSIESYEHPLKQALGAGVGVILAILGGSLGCLIGGGRGILLVLSCLFVAATLFRSRREGNQLIKSLIWNVAVGVLSLGSIYLLAHWVTHVFL